MRRKFIQRRQARKIYKEIKNGYYSKKNVEKKKQKNGYNPYGWVDNVISYVQLIILIPIFILLGYLYIGQPKDITCCLKWLVGLMVFEMVLVAGYRRYLWFNKAYYASNKNNRMNILHKEIESVQKKHGFINEYAMLYWVKEQLKTSIFVKLLSFVAAVVNNYLLVKYLPAYDGTRVMLVGLIIANILTGYLIQPVIASFNSPYFKELLFSRYLIEKIENHIIESK